MRNIYFALAIVLTLLMACEPEIPMVTSGLENSYAIERMKALRLHPEYSGERYEWSMPDTQGHDSIVATTCDYLFISAHPGVYRLKLQIIDSITPFTHDMVITVWEEELA